MCVVLFTNAIQYPIVSALSIVECNILYWRHLSKRIMIVSICHIIHMYRPTCLLHELNAHYYYLSNHS